MLILKKKNHNQSGNAVIEILPILTISILLVNFSLGFFGVIHSGILNSIGARNYAFETFRNRPNLHYLRDTLTSDVGFTYSKSEQRFHAVITENLGQKFFATRRPIEFSEKGGVDDIKDKDHENSKRIVAGRRTTEGTGIDEEDGGVNPVWVKTSYGICLNSTCGGG